MLQDGKNFCLKGHVIAKMLILCSLYMGHPNPSQLQKLSYDSMALKMMKVILSSSCPKGKEQRFNSSSNNKAFGSTVVCFWSM